jgi:hypothetical protein
VLRIVPLVEPEPEVELPLVEVPLVERPVVVLPLVELPLVLIVPLVDLAAPVFLLPLAAVVEVVEP